MSSAKISYPLQNGAINRLKLRPALLRAIQSMGCQSRVESLINPAILWDQIEMCPIPFHLFTDFQKVLIFCVTIVNSIDFNVGKLQAIILAKTKDSFDAIENTISSLTTFIKLKNCCVFRPYENAMKKPTPCCQIVLGKPDVIANLFKTRSINADHIKWVVFDELDQFIASDYSVVTYLPRSNLRVYYTSSRCFEIIENTLKNCPQIRFPKEDNRIQINKSKSQPKKKGNKKKTMKKEEKNNSSKNAQQVQHPKVKTKNSIQSSETKKKKNKRNRNGNPSKAKAPLKAIKIKSETIENDLLRKTFGDLQVIKTEPNDSDVKVKDDLKNEPFSDCETSKTKPIDSGVELDEGLADKPYSNLKIVETKPIDSDVKLEDDLKDVPSNDALITKTKPDNIDEELRNNSTDEPFNDVQIVKTESTNIDEKFEDDSIDQLFSDVQTAATESINIDEKLEEDLIGEPFKDIHIFKTEPNSSVEKLEGHSNDSQIVQTELVGAHEKLENDVMEKSLIGQ